MTAAEIRAQYPHPRRFSCNAVGTISKYCVLGAACLFAGKKEWWYAFPDKELASYVLGISQMEAEAVFSENDQGHFDSAWDLLDMALKRIGPSEPGRKGEYDK